MSNTCDIYETSDFALSGIFSELELAQCVACRMYVCIHNGKEGRSDKVQAFKRKSLIRLGTHYVLRCLWSFFKLFYMCWDLCTVQHVSVPKAKWHFVVEPDLKQKSVMYYTVVIHPCCDRIYGLPQRQTKRETSIRPLLGIANLENSDAET